MPRPERSLDPSAGPIPAFALKLRELRLAAGSPKYLQMARQTGRSRTALAEAAGGDHLPTWETVEAYVRACGADPHQWLPLWEQVKERTRNVDGLVTQPSTPSDETNVLSVPVGEGQSSNRQRTETSPEPGREHATIGQSPAGSTSAEPVKPFTRSRSRRWGSVASFAAGVVLGAALPTAMMITQTHTRPEAQILPTSDRGPTQVSFSHFAAFTVGNLATGDAKGTIRIWDAGTARQVRRMDSHEPQITALAFDPRDRDMLASGGTDGVVQIWDTTSGTSQFSIQCQQAGAPILLAFDPENRGMLAMGGAGGTVKIWDSRNHRLARALTTGDPHVDALAFDPRGGGILAVGGIRGVRLWNTETGHMVQAMHHVNGPVTALGFDPLTLNTLAIATANAPPGIWDTSNGQMVRSVPTGHPVTALDFNPQIRNSLATSSNQGHVQIWDSSNGHLIHSLPLPTAFATTLRYAADGKTLAAGGSDGKTRIWPIADW